MYKSKSNGSLKMAYGRVSSHWASLFIILDEAIFINGKKTHNFLDDAIPYFIGEICNNGSYKMDALSSVNM